MEARTAEKQGVVALRKESVDRNLHVWGGTETGKTSLSARRAWIEITVCIYKICGTGRSPQGERG